MPAFQIQVQGALDGATAFAIPATLPAPANGGVIKIDAGVAVAVGTFDLNALIRSFNVPVWIRALHTEFAPLTRAARFRLTNPGSRTPDQLLPDLESATAAPLMRPYVLTPGCIAPAGSLLTVLTDDTNDTFGGAPVAGPHFVYLDLEPIRDDAQMGLIQDMGAFASAKAKAEGEVMESFQAVAASLTTELGIVSPPRNDASGAMMLQSIRITNGAVAAAGESLVVTVNRITVGTGAVVALGTFTIDATVPANSISLGALNQSLNLLTAGDRIQVVRTYTAGGGPTPMTNTLVRVALAPVAF